MVGVKEVKVVLLTGPAEEAGGGKVELGEGGGGCVGESEPSLIGVEVEAVLDPVLGRLRLYDVVCTGGKEGEVGEVGDKGGV